MCLVIIDDDKNLLYGYYLSKGILMIIYFRYE